MKRSAEEARERPERRLRPRPPRPPRPLAAVLGIAVIVGLAWALLVPPWQSPDEVSHYAYVESLAAGFQLPGHRGLPEVSSEQGLADYAVGASRGAFYPESVPPDWSASDDAAYLAREHAKPAPSRSDGAGPNPAGSNPPLYYLYAAIPYLIDSGGTSFGRLYAIRIWGVLLLALTVLGGWLLAGETLGRRRPAQLACAAVVGLMPMETFIATSVNPDALMTTLWTFALWLGVRVINRALPACEAVALCAVTAAAILTKATSYALVPAVALALLCGWLRVAPAQRHAAVRRLVTAVLALAVPVLGWLGLASALNRSAVNTIAPTAQATPFNVRQFLSYVWQFYLPRLPSMIQLRETAGLPIYDVWLRQGIGTFGWLVVVLPGWLYTVVSGVIGAIAVAAAGLTARIRDRRRLAVVAFLALALLGLLGGLHLTDYRSIIAGSGPVLQGRYLLPMLGLFGLAVGQIVTHVPARVRPVGVGLTLAGLLALQVISLVAVINVYYL